MSALVLSSQQEALLDWVRAAAERGVERRPFNAFASFVIEGALDVAALRRAFGEIVWYQPTLRTSYHYEDGAWAVRVAELPPPLKLIVSDLTHLPPDERMPAVREGLADEARTAFPLHVPVRLRVGLYRLEERRHVLSVAVDHLVSDLDSLQIILDALGRHYGEPLSAEPTFAFFEFAEHQRRAVRGAAADAGLAFWRDHLGAPGPNASYRLPFDLGPACAPGPVDGRAVTRTLSPELLERLDAACRHSGSTRFRVVLAALALVVRDYTGQDQVVLRSPDRNRDYLLARGREDVVGWFGNLLNHRVDLSAKPTLNDILDRIRATSVGMQAHKDLTIYELTRALTPEEYGKPRTGTWVVLNAIGRPELTLPGLACRPTGYRPPDLPPMMVEAELVQYRGGADLSVIFDANRYPEPAAAEFLDRLLAAIERFCGDRTAGL